MDITKFTSKDIDAIFDASQRFSVGFDDLFYRLHSYGVGMPSSQYPPYNIVKESNVKWRIELALAGWAAEDIGRKHGEQCPAHQVKDSKGSPRGRLYASWRCNEDLC